MAHAHINISIIISRNFFSCNLASQLQNCKQSDLGFECVMLLFETDTLTINNRGPLTVG